ncbi:hypothetical protein HPP92_022271 [Vanilla planifolia]|uniref:DAGKc domain-containing protein n=1 Tax=Vanilla planifolia TaxID=51239 RepID=A0A835PNT8_VANPL|nr:hypothetical protein HPP92_022588 [Vanilla planifolia]KAG0459143.1 hypothetical protein HPP92_022271 [Vanilla planifolia]
MALESERHDKVKALKASGPDFVKNELQTTKSHEHRIDIGDELSDLLGFEVVSGKLAYDKNYKNFREKKTHSETINATSVNAKLTREAFVWGSRVLRLEDVISVSCQRKYYAMEEEATRWVKAFADQQCYINCSSQPMVSKKNITSDVDGTEPLFEEPQIKCRTPPKVLIILNPRSGCGRSSKVFHSKVETLFQLAGFEMEVVKTTSAGHARKLASNVDFGSCPDGIICVGGDGIVNEVLNGLLSRTDQKEAISIPIGIIPAGSDNALAWTVLGVRDPLSAALAIIKEQLRRKGKVERWVTKERRKNAMGRGLTAMDVFAVEWIQNGLIHFGTTASYFGFLSDVLELSQKYQKRCGPLRYFVAGFLKFLCLPKYKFELEYLPTSKELLESQGMALDEQDGVDLSDLYTDVMRKSIKEGIPRASSLSSIDSVFSPTIKRTVVELEPTCSTSASIEPSEYVRGLDPKAKRLSMGRNNMVEEPEEVLHPKSANWPRTRSKSRTDKGWAGLTTIPNDTRFSWATTALNDEDISSTISDPGPLWDSQPKWDAEPNWETDNSIQLPGSTAKVDPPFKKEPNPKKEVKWEFKKGQFLGVLVCNHSCRTVQSLSSQVVAPARHDDNSLDLLLIHGCGEDAVVEVLPLLAARSASFSSVRRVCEGEVC